MKVSEAILARRSVRQYRDKRVPHDQLEELVNYARLAPSGMNKQPLEFVIVDDPKLERKFFDYTSWAGSVEWSPSVEERPRAYIAILINENITPATDKRDSGLAAGNICLGAVEMGLGSCLLGALEREDIKELLDIPDDRSISVVVSLGYPDQEIVLEDNQQDHEYWREENGTFHVPKKPIDDIMHVNGW